ncbi:flocculation protein FLO11-like isoform X2 [Micropterus salmoides]|uniref:flocculation protein FLO11-like isoform X2 n=1 Tax=Micropterus salmoides TaxID=27706 RepID=UPI0018EA8729|nr:flocculation protein FLO11-like isoform X2 [Micropterus salmoides]
MNCQTPSSVSESQCFFYTLSGGTVSDSSCLKTLTGTELLKTSNQSSPAEVKVLCFYTVKPGELDSPSPHSDTSSITIHSSSVRTPSTKDSPFPVSTPNKASDSFSEMRAQAVLPPTLTVNPSVITETDSVTLNCQTPSSVSMSECYFRTVRGGPAKRFSCLQTLTGTELLKITNQSSPAEVKVTCFYLYVSSSPDSDVSSIIVRTSLPPKLTVNPPIITETESVTMNCQTPSSVSESQCFFYTLSGGTVSDSSCLKTLTGTELLKMAKQSSPAEVKVLCFYTVKLGELDSPSPHSDTSSITIHSSSVCTPSTKDSPFPVSTPNKASAVLPPTLTVNPSVITETGSVTLNCQTPSSVSMSECYFRTVRGGPAKRFSCLQKLTGTELLKITNQSSPAEVKVTCFYLYVSSSPDSDVSSIIVRTSLPPKLTVNPPIITETESVTMNCQTPSSVSESQCFFYTLSGGTVSDSSCLKTLTGTELLKMANQSSPAEVKVLCFYTVKLGELDSPSPHSDTSSITIHSSSVCTPSTKDSPFPVSTPNKASAVLPPTLTVNPSVITETDSVTLNCQTPSSVSMSECYFRTVRGGPAKRFSCLQKLTGTELLKITNQSSPAEVKVTCFYLYVSSSPDSDVSSIIIRTSLLPKLTVNPPIITETESVTMNCQTPSSVSESQCFFYTLSGGTVSDSSCLKILTGTELLKMANQSSPAEVKVLCFYTVKLGELDSPSLHSDTSSITIHSQTPQLTLQHFPGDHVLFACSLPGSANHDTRCNLYFGEASHPVITTTIGRKRDPKTNQWFCQFTVTIDDLLSRLRLLQQSDASCDYSLGSEPNSLSPRSDGYSLIALTVVDIVERESTTRQTKSTFFVTTGWTVGTPSNTGGSTSTSLTPEKPTLDSRMTPLNLESGGIWKMWIRIL